VYCVGVEKATSEDEWSELESLRSRYDQAVRERDDVQRAYTHARHEVDILVESLQQMKTDRDAAITHHHHQHHHQQTAVRAPATPSTGLTA